MILLQCSYYFPQNFYHEINSHNYPRKFHHFYMQIIHIALQTPSFLSWQKQQYTACQRRYFKTTKKSPCRESGISARHGLVAINAHHSRLSLVVPSNWDNHRGAGNRIPDYTAVQAEHLPDQFRGNHSGRGALRNQLPIFHGKQMIRIAG